MTWQPFERRRPLVVALEEGVDGGKISHGHPTRVWATSIWQDEVRKQPAVRKPYLAGMVRLRLIVPSIVFGSPLKR